MFKTNKPLNPPALNDLFDSFRNEIAKSINCVQVGIIQSFDSATQTASIQLAIKKVVNVAPDGTRTLQEYPVLYQCPVMILTGGAGHLTFPISPGDTCIVLFNDREIDNWFSSGGVQAPSSPRVHDKSDGIAIVGIRNVQNAISDYLDNGIRLRLDADTSIEMTPGEIAFNGNFTFNGNVQINGILSSDYAGKQIEYNTHTHSGVVPGGGNTGEPNDI